MDEFGRNVSKSSEQLFIEMCFCILTANYRADRVLEIVDKIDRGFIDLEYPALRDKLRELGYRYPNVRAKYIVENRWVIPILKDIIMEYSNDLYRLRNWLSKNIKGLGYKEASHFMRNIGFRDIAIIDFHILRILVNHDIIAQPKYLSKKVYLEIEDILRRIARDLGVSLAELDLYLWYIETGKILK
jgi:N-glycosylase/DNA lyase